MGVLGGVVFVEDEAREGNVGYGGGGVDGAAQGIGDQKA